MEQKNQIIKTYRDKSVTENFDKERGKYLYQKYKHEIESNFLKRTFEKIPCKKIKVLDVACGTGRMLPEVFSIEKEIEYIGFDSSEEMTKHLKDKSKKMGIEKKVKIKIGDATKIPFEDNSFDIVYSYHLLWHIPKEEQKKIINEMLRVCKKEGFIIFDILNKNFVYEKIKKKHSKDLYKFTFNELKEIISSKKVEIEKLNDFPIKNDKIYKIINIINQIRGFLPKNLYHMIFFRVKK
jgi:ubiquinone/menaquinone biosynthesis C-methylase UbiE